MKNIKQYLIPIILFVVIGYGCSSGGGQNSSEVNSDSASINLAVIHTTERDSHYLVGRIARFLIVVEGDNLQPIKLNVSANAHEVEIENVAPGENRKITVTAFNRDDQAIREGVSELFSIAKGETKEVSVKLEAIPVFINVHDGNVVSNKRLVFEILADPGESLTVEDVTEKSVEPLVSLSTNSNEISTNASTGLGLFNPMNVRLGERTFQARSTKTGKFSNVKLVVTDFELRKPAPLYSAGQISLKNINLQPSRLGQWSARPSTSGQPPIGELWPNILNQELHSEVKP